jgi:hypothetical protein
MTISPMRQLRLTCVLASHGEYWGGARVSLPLSKDSGCIGNVSLFLAAVLLPGLATLAKPRKREKEEFRRDVTVGP